MKKAATAIVALTFLMMFTAIAPALAVGPTRAALVGNNPNVFINPVNQKTALNTPRGEKCALDRITWLSNTIFLYINVSNVNGLNNAIIADINTVNGMIANPSLYENKWIYLSGENAGNNYDGHGMFYWWIRSQGFSDEQALASILERNPDGGYVKTNYISR